MATERSTIPFQTNLVLHLISLLGDDVTQGGLLACGQHKATLNRGYARPCCKAKGLGDGC